MSFNRRFVIALIVRSGNTYTSAHPFGINKLTDHLMIRYRCRGHPKHQGYLSVASFRNLRIVGTSGIGKIRDKTQRNRRFVRYV